MQVELFESTLRSFSRRAPFRSFMVEQNSGAQIEVDHPEAMVIRSGVAVYVSPNGALTILDHESVSRVVGAAEAATS